MITESQFSDLDSLIAALEDAMSGWPDIDSLDKHKAQLKTVIDGLTKFLNSESVDDEEGDE